MRRLLLPTLVALAWGCGTPERPLPAVQRSAVLPGEGLFVCLPIPTARGRVTRVTPAEVGQLRAVIEGAQPNETVVLADGTYPWSGIGGTAPIAITAPGLTLRSESARADAVVIDGEMAPRQLFAVGASDVTLTDLTLARFAQHLVRLLPLGPQTIRGFQFHRMRLIDVTGYAVDALELSAQNAFADEGVVQCSHFELTDTGRAVLPCQAGAMRVWSGRDWVFRLNRVEGYHCDGGLYAPAVFAWFGARDMRVENNVFRDDQRAIAFGLSNLGSLRVYPDDPYPTLSPAIDSYGGIARNNFVSGASQRLETGIASENGRDVTFAHNTVFPLDSGPGFFASFDIRYANASVQSDNNIGQNFRVRDSAPAPTGAGNLMGAPGTLFLDAVNQDLHLAPTAAAAIDSGGLAAGPPVDIDGADRSDGLPDVGADELGTARPLLVSTPERGAACGVPYGYAPAATGTGPFSFSLSSATPDPLPAGLTLNAGTGAIAWTPTNAQVGLHELDLRLDGPTGVDVQRVNIEVECQRAPPYAVGCGVVPGSGADAPGGLWTVAALVGLVLAATRRSRLRSAASLATTPRLR